MVYKIKKKKKQIWKNYVVKENMCVILKDIYKKREREGDDDDDKKEIKFQ